MQIIEKYKWLVVAAVVVIVGGLLYINNKSSVDDANKDAKHEVSQEEKKAEEARQKEAEAKAKAEAAKTGKTTYTARLGDSYTVLARKSIQTYADATQTEVSKAQIVAAETFLTIDAGSPYLNLGQKVTVDKSVVAKAVAKAQALSPAEIAAWQTYVPYVNFDTSNNG